MLPVSEFPILDRNAAHHGVPASRLMENAGAAVAELVRSRHPAGSRVLVLCGPGNNGGDGFVAARHLEAGNDVSVVLLDDDKGIRNRLCMDNLRRVGHLLRDWDEALLHDCDVVVDAMLGTGLSGAPRRPFEEVIASLAGFDGDLVSVDVPSGWRSRAALRPSATVTFHDRKRGMGTRGCGQVVVADIGIPREAEAETGPGECLLYPMPAPSSHKGQNGRVLILGGGPYTGAPSLAGMGCCHIGADMVHVATPSPSFTPVACHSPLFIVHHLAGPLLGCEHIPAIEGLLESVDALLIGPGLGRSEGSMEAVSELLRRAPVPLVVDADALMAIPDDMPRESRSRMLLTPHGREFERLSGRRLPSGIERRSSAVRRLASEMGCAVLLKGEVDVISDGRRVKLNRGGNAAMSSGGTGDVLAGVAAGLLSKGLEPFDAGRLAAYIVGLAGDAAFAARSYGMTAVDLYDAIPAALRDGLRSRGG